MVITITITPTPITTITTRITTEPAFTTVITSGDLLTTRIPTTLLLTGITTMAGAGEQASATAGDNPGELITIHGALGDTAITHRMAIILTVLITGIILMATALTATTLTVIPAMEIRDTIIITTTASTAIQITTDQERPRIRTMAA